MGMDLVPINKDACGFSTNWSGWEGLVGALRLLDCDTSRVSFENSGKRVLKAQALEWADKLERALRAGMLRRKAGQFGWSLDLSDDLPTGIHLAHMEEFIGFLWECQGFRQY